MREMSTPWLSEQMDGENSIPETVRLKQAQAMLDLFETEIADEAAAHLRKSRNGHTAEITVICNSGSTSLINP